MLKDQIKTAASLLDEAQQYLLSDLSALQELDCYPVDPLAPFRLALERSTESAQARRVEITAQIPETTPLVMAEFDMLRDILETLIATLLEDAVAGGNLVLTLHAKDPWLVWEFRNQGLGLPNAKFQTWLNEDDQETTPLFQRLRIARRQVKNWKGQLQGASALGEGMRFVLQLPCFGSEVSAEPLSLYSRHSLHSQQFSPVSETAKRILVIDDNKMIQRLTVISLQKEGYQVRATANGQRAIELLSEWIPDLIVLDMMPVMDGWQFLQWRQQHQPNLPILALTGIENPVSESQILTAGVNAILFKPTPIPDLLARIDHLLSSRHTTTPSSPLA